MKKNFIFGWLLCLAPVWAGAQVVDTAAVVREVDSLIQVSRALTGQRDFDKALEVNAAAGKLALEKLGRETAAYGSICQTHGRILQFKIDFAGSEIWYLEAKVIREKVLGKIHPDYAQTINSLANLYYDWGDYENAVTSNLEVASIREKLVGKEHLDYAMCLNNLANSYLEISEYEKSETLHLESKAIRERLAGKEHPDFAQSLLNLSFLYYRMGDYHKAEASALEGRDIVEKVFGKEHLYYAGSLNLLANVYFDLEDYRKSIDLNLEAKIIMEKFNVNEFFNNYAWTLNNLANSYLGAKDYGRAEATHLENKAFREKALGKQHPDYAMSLSNLANVYRKMGKYESAEPLYLEAKAIYENLMGNKHPEYAEILNGLANLYWRMGILSKVEPMLVEISTLNQYLISKASNHLSERELNRYLIKFSKTQNQLLSFAQTNSSKNFHSPQACYSNTLFYKGFLLQAANQLRHSALLDSAKTEKLHLLKSYQRRLSTQYTKPIAERDSIRIVDLEEKANALEKDLARTVAGYGAAIRQVTWQEVQTTLKPDEAALEFIHYRYHMPEPTDSIMYAALVLRPGDNQPHFIPLFEEKELATLLRGAAGGNNFLKINALYTPQAAGSKSKSLYELIWQPLESLLAGSKTVYCSPSGLLHRINLAAIPASDGKAFGDSRQLVLLGSTRQLVVPSAVTPSGNTAYLVGGIRYDTDSTAIAYANRGTSGSRSIEQPSALAFQPDSLSATRGGVLDYLPATAAEVREIGQTLTAAGIRAKVDTGFYATEEAFRQLGVAVPSPRIVHLATHGYFFPDPVSKGQKANSNFGQEPVFKMSEHPMIRSGLILAGAKQAWLTGKHPVGQEDGILTAYEISQMNLSGTELVVLSACETGLGDIMGNEGVYGLQRAFKIAGAKYLVMSLWKVDDRSTQEFMTAFYRHWLTDKQPVPQAFRAAQREVRAKHPGAYDWAGFVLIE